MNAQHTKVHGKHGDYAIEAKGLVKRFKSGKSFVEVLKIFNLGRARFTYTLSVEEASIRLPLLPPHSPARDQLSAIYLDYFNNYATLRTYADHHGLTETQTSKLLELARDVHTSNHPES